MRLQTRRGFTLVELLVVITILGILMALLLPAIQSVREAGRRTTCQNYVKQLGQACLAHEGQWTWLPTGGWSERFAGDPDRGFGKRQPGGWHYNILPFIDELDLHNGEELADGATERKEEKKVEGKARAETALGLLICPSRRRMVAFPYPKKIYVNIDQPSVIGRSDYAACAGDKDSGTYWKGPRDVSRGDSMTNSQWRNRPGTSDTGVIYRRSMCKFGHITGRGSVYLLGERYLNPDYYDTGLGVCDNQGWDAGYDCDVNRWTCNDDDHKPMQDQSGLEHGRAFGSAHPAGFHMFFCDGSVSFVNYSIDQDIHRMLGNRKEGARVDFTRL